MSCLSQFQLPFTAAIKVPEGFSFDLNSKTFSMSVCTDDLKIHVEPISYPVPDDLKIHVEPISYPVPDEFAPKNPCNPSESLSNLTTELYEIRAVGALKYRLAIKFLTGSPNFEISPDISSTVTKESWSSSDGIIQLVNSDNNNSANPYIIIDYSTTPDIPIGKTLTVILSNIETDGYVGLLTGDKYVAISGYFKFQYQ